MRPAFLRDICRRCLAGIEDVIFPRHCLLSGSYLGDASTLLPSVDDLALALEIGAPTGAALEVLLQRHVEADDYLLFRVSSCWSVCTTSKIDSVIYAIKYGGRMQLAIELGKLMAQHPDMSNPSDDLIIAAIPIHRARQRERGYNQSQLLATGLASSLNRQLLDEGVICRRRYTPTQTSLGQHERQRNVQNAFFVSQPAHVRNRHLILVDDVLTTGATLNACATALIEAGARRVDAITACVAT